MARNGSGTFNLLVNSWNPATNGVPATAADWQSLINDIASALTQSVSRDGQTTITGNLPMGGNKITGLAAGIASGDALAWQQLFSQGLQQDVASAATVDLGAVNSTLVNITGTTSITSFGTNYNGPRFIRFDGILTLTNSATLVLPTGANITTAAGDSAIAVPLGNPATGWRVVAYQRANGAPLVGATDFLNTTRIDVASASTVDLTASAPNTRHIRITGTTTIISFTVAAGQTYFVVFGGALTLTNNANIVTNTGANIAVSAGDSCIIRATAANTVEVINYEYVTNPVAQGGTGSSTGPILRGNIDGLTMSTAGSSTTMTIAAGQATDSTAAALLTRATSIDKTTASWAVGNAVGGLDTGTIANSTWYYFYLIRRPDTGVVDVVFSTNSTSPTLPTNYTQFRYIGAGLTNGSGQWTRFTQFGDVFYWAAPVLDFSGAGSATATLMTCSVPRGRKMLVHLSVNATNNQGTYISDPANDDLTPSLTVSPGTQYYLGSASANAGIAYCMTNTSAQVRRREFGTGSINYFTMGWTDLRGRNA